MLNSHVLSSLFSHLFLPETGCKKTCVVSPNNASITLKVHFKSSSLRSTFVNFIIFLFLVGNLPADRRILSRGDRHTAAIRHHCLIPFDRLHKRRIDQMTLVDAQEDIRVFLLYRRDSLRAFIDIIHTVNLGVMSHTLHMKHLIVRQI